ncbi:hypothetical protein [Carnobacterium maltaromaticum]|nr:hypothetical protein [Carnobacterium maltaromaticum]
MNEQIILTSMEIHGILMTLSIELECSDLDDLMDLVLEKSFSITIGKGE